MPELPEVETVRRSLEPGIYDGEVASVRTSKLKLRQRAIGGAALERALVGARFVGTRRHGKYLLLDVSSGQTVLVHLGMSGQLWLGAGDAPMRPHTHVRIGLSSGRELRYVDPRRFGIVRLYATDSIERGEELRELGPDPLGARFDAATFAHAISGTKRDLKSVLLDQRVLAGVGNIYASEALFEARLSPKRRAHRLRSEERTALFLAVGVVLRRGVENRGTTLSDYVDASGVIGGNQHSLLVYGRAGGACRRCQTPIRRFTQAGRSTYFCARCQASK